MTNGVACRMAVLYLLNVRRNALDSRAECGAGRGAGPAFGAALAAGAGLAIPGRRRETAG